MRISTALLAATLVFVCAGAQAQAYRWVDKDGKVRYGDSPPPGVKATLMKGAHSPPSSPPSAAAAPKDAKGAAKAPANSEQAFAERQLKAKEDAAKAEKESASAAARQKNCDQAQGVLRSLESGQRISAINAQGERTFLDDAGRQAQIEDTKAEIGRSCK